MPDTWRREIDARGGKIVDVIFDGGGGTRPMDSSDRIETMSPGRM